MPPNFRKKKCSRKGIGVLMLSLALLMFSMTMFFFVSRRLPEKFEDAPIHLSRERERKEQQALEEAFDKTFVDQLSRKEQHELAAIFAETLVESSEDEIEAAVLEEQEQVKEQYQSAFLEEQEQFEEQDQSAFLEEQEQFEEQDQSQYKCQPAEGKDADNYQTVRFVTTKGEFTIQLRPDLAPHGVQHLTSLISGGFYDAKTVSVFSINSWTIMFGADEIPSRPEWKEPREFPNKDNKRKDDNPCETGQTWIRTVVAMMGGPHVMIVKKGNPNMGKNEHDAPAGYVVDGMEVVDALFGYDDEAQKLAGPSQKKIVEEGGNQFLKDNFPKLDYILSAHFDDGPS